MMPWKDPEIAKAKGAEYRRRNREKIARLARERYAESPERRRESNRRSLFKKKYGITLYDKASMLDEQGGCCAICRTDKPPTSTGWHIDHCHTEKRIRGILCQHCNNMLGMAKDDPSILARAIEYLGGSHD